MPEYLSCEQIAERYSVKKRTVWEWIRKKKLPAIKLGKDYRIRSEDLREFEENCLTVKKTCSDK